MHVRFLIVIFHFIIERAIMAVSKWRVIVLVTVPGGLVIPAADYTILVVMRDVIVVMRMNLRRMGVLRLFAIILNPLLLSHDSLL